MCQIGDLIRIEDYIGDDGEMVNRHTFVVLSTEGDKIRGLSFDLVASPMSSIKSEEQREKVEKDKGLMIIRTNDQNGMPTSKYEESFIKAKLMYYFDKSSIDYKVLGALNVETFMELQEKLNELSESKNLIQVLTNIESVA